MERARERDAMSICETVKTQKQYYIHNMRYGYIPINRRLHRERESKRERLYPSVKWWKHRNCTICVLQDLHISLWIGDCIERTRERERAREEEREREWADRLSGHFIWNMNSYIISVCTLSWSLHLTILGGLDLTTYDGTSSENLNSHLILVTSSDKFWGVYLTELSTSSANLTR